MSRPDDRSSAATVRHLLAHSSGLANRMSLRCMRIYPDLVMCVRLLGAGQRVRRNRVLGLHRHGRGDAPAALDQAGSVFNALAFVNSPELVFLDELTQGLDPQTRRATRDLIQEIRPARRTTQFRDGTQDAQRPQGSS
jgi:hypothetical protein